MARDSESRPVAHRRMSSMTDQLRISLLGGLRITLGGSPLTDFTSKKSPALLGYLAVTARAHTREALSGLLWGESSDDRARASLRTVLWDLRQHVAPYLVVERHSAALKEDAPCWLDVAAFSRRIETTLPALSGAAQQEEGAAILEDDHVDALEAAVALYHGDFMAGFYVPDAPAFEAWVLKKREWARQLAMQALHRLIVHHTARGAYVSGIDTASSLLEIAPWKEEAHRQLMLLLALSGQRGAALAQYETCRRMLAEELGVDPTVETHLLYERIQGGEPLQEQESAQGSPPSSRAPSRRGHLPARSGRFVGRQDELARLEGWLGDPQVRMVTLAGPDGVGKTHLALVAARQAAGRFDDGVWFVPAAGDGVAFEQSARPGEETALAALPLAVARALGVTFFAASSPETQLLDYVRQRRLLLVLDDPKRSQAQLEWIRRLLGRALYVTLLVTSPLPLDLPGERNLYLEGLLVPPAAADRFSDDVLTYAAVELFVDRARRVQKAFQLDAESTRGVVRICQALRGLPLAIEMAAAWMDQDTPAAVARDVQRATARTAAAAPGMPAHQRGLRAAFSYAWGRLAPALQAGLARLTVFRETFSADAASAVTGVIQPDLDLFVEKALLNRPTAGHYAWHVALRELAIERRREADPAAEETAAGTDHGGKGSALAARQAAYYLDLVERQSAALHGPQPQTALSAMRRAWGNVRLAWRWAATHADLDGLTRGLEGMSRFLLLHGPLWEGEALLGATARVLQADSVACAQPAGKALLARLLVEQARFMNEQARHGPAIQTAQAALEAARSRGLEEVSLEAAARLQWGRALAAQGNFAEAYAQLEQGLAEARAAAAAPLQAGCLLHLGAVALCQERYDEARDRLAAALRHYRAAGSRRGEAGVQAELGVVALVERRYAAARSQLQRALYLFQALGDRRGAGSVHSRLARLAIAQGDYPAARAQGERALTIARDIGDRQGEARALSNMGLLLLHEGHNEAAWNRSLQAVELARALGDRANEGRALIVLGHAFMELEMPPQAARAYDEALALQRVLEQSGLAAEALAGLARVQLIQGDAARAQACVEEILEQLSVDGLKGAHEPIRVYLTCYQILQASNDPRAAEVLSAASGLFDAVNDVRDV